MLVSTVSDDRFITSCCSEGKAYAALETTSMIAGALAFFVYAVACVYLMSKRHLGAGPSAYAMLVGWGFCAFGLWWLFLR
jgi:hypothetical protein